MSLLERYFPVLRHNYNFFDPLRENMERDFHSAASQKMEKQMLSMQEYMDREMKAMRGRMFQLMPASTVLDSPDLFQSVGSDLQAMKNSFGINDNQMKSTLVPILIEEKGETKVKLDFDVHGFKPEEVKVKVLGNNILQVLAQSDEKTETSVSHRTYMRQYTLPKEINVDQIKSTLSKDGVLSIEAPAPSLSLNNEKLIPIQNI